MTREPKIGNLRDGSEWAEHEDFIVGDETGIQALKRACEVALSDGEYFGDDLGEWVGVKKLESEWFRAPRDSSKTLIQNLVIASVLGGVAILAVVGAIALVSWLLSQTP